MRCLTLALLAVFCLPAGAADWLTVARDQGRKVELDRASVLTSDPGTKVAWGRIVLTDAEARKAGYQTIKALNRYDCRSQTFVTVKRVYADMSGIAVREESAGSQAPVSIAPGSIDDRFFREVCKPASVDQLRQLAADAAGKAAQTQRPGVARADLQLARDEAPAAASAPPPATAEKPIGKPKLIDLPPKPHGKPAEQAAAEAAPASVRAAPVSSLPPAPRPRTYAPPPRKSVTPKEPMQAPASHAGEPVYHATHWSYEGEGGPQNWGRLKPEFATCSSGTRQSPIDIRDGLKVDLDPIRFDYRPSYIRIIDNGHTIQVTVGPGLTISIMGRTYELQQFHFHRPSEERIDGRSFEMVAHLVHKDLDGRLAVVAVLLDRGAAHPLIQTIWNNLPLEKHESYAPPNVTINPADLLPAERGYFTYMGSLTTPPCSEGVLWMVMRQPVQVSPEQISIFSRFYRNNARPIQPSGGRTIKESR